MAEHDGTRTGGFGSGLLGGLAEKVIEPILTAVRGEIDAVREELLARATAARTGALLTAVGSVLAIVTAALLAGAVVAVLGLWLPVWAGLAITLVLFAVATALVLRSGVRGLQRGATAPPARVEPAKETSAQ